MTTLKTGDEILADCKAAKDYKRMVETEAAMIDTVQLEGFHKNPHDNTKLSKECEGKDDIRETKKLIRFVAKSMGYPKTNSAKMLGGSETLEMFEHPERPNHKLLMHVKPRTVMGVRVAWISLSVEVVH